MRIRIISPYFVKENGSLPKHFQLYLNSCKANPEFEWLFVTNADMSQYDIPQNMAVVCKEFAEFRAFVQSKFDFPISLEDPYKLCDYKVLYGYVFAEYLQDYDFWGYADSTDLIWGRLSNFITEDVLAKFDKIYTKGHLTLYRNEEPFARYFLQYEKDGLTYRNAISDKESWATDETGRININDAWRYAGYAEYICEEDIADISPLSFELRMATQLPSGKIVEEENCHRVFEWVDGRLFGYSIEGSNVLKKEYAYLHFQKREMEMCLLEDAQKNHFFVIPNRFIDEMPVEVESIKKVTAHKWFYKKFFELKFKGLKNRVKRRMTHE